VTDFRKRIQYQISCKSIQWEQSCAGRTDRHDEANTRLSKCCKGA